MAMLRPKKFTKNTGSTIISRISGLSNGLLTGSYALLKPIRRLASYAKTLSGAKRLPRKGLIEVRTARPCPKNASRVRRSTRDGVDSTQRRVRGRFTGCREHGLFVVRSRRGVRQAARW